MNRDLREIVREEPLVRDRLRELLLERGSLSVAALAEAAGFPSDEVMIWIAGMRKYGYVADSAAERTGGEPRYVAVKDI